ncbi:thioredoxin family protein [Nostocoides sp. F2B08]|uniref:thioredoxin family protein n=1 Tax=Nostocoides sp. F2B08 TaxID=2653936 RepID=UPI0012635B87|nr:thioredoxin family protein [Tetrasphaera sp. F2B08]KAB7743453.1 thioredoxin family protein [Tetrasphaera sp. F2B08]
MRIKVLGPGCKNCHKLEHNTQVALDRLGLHETIEKVTDYGEIAGYGVMKTPALVIDDTVVLSGKVATPEEITPLLATATT